MSLKRKAEESLALAQRFFVQTTAESSDDPVKILANMVASDLKKVSKKIFMKAKFTILEALKTALTEQALLDESEPINVNEKMPTKTQPNLLTRFRTISSSSMSSSPTPCSSSTEISRILTSTPQARKLTNLPVYQQPTVNNINKSKIDIVDVHVVKQSIKSQGSAADIQPNDDTENYTDEYFENFIIEDRDENAIDCFINSSNTDQVMPHSSILESYGRNF